MAAGLVAMADWGFGLAVNGGSAPFAQHQHHAIERFAFRRQNVIIADGAILIGPLHQNACLHLMRQSVAQNRARDT